MDALQFLKKAKPKLEPVYVLAGDEDFLKRQALAKIRPLVIGEADPEFATSRFEESPDFSAVRNELETAPFLAPKRLVVIQPADQFVTKNRPKLEKYVPEPASSGVLVLDVKTWPGTTKLAKLIADGGTIVCKAPAEYRVPAWCVDWAKTGYGKKLATPAAELLVELIGPQLGMLDQELDKLAVFVGDRELIGTNDVDQLVGRSRGANVFKILEAVGDGQPAAALKILNELFVGGEDPLAILGALGSQVRKLAAVSRLIRQGNSIDNALDEAGVPKWPKARDGARKQLRHLGQRRLDNLYDWLLEADLGLKGGSRLPPELLLERMIVRMARPRE